MTEFEISSIKKQWEAGVPIQQIVQTMPYKRRTAENYIWKLRVDGVLPERNKRNGKELVSKAYNSGIKNPYEIAEMYGYAPKSVQTWLSELNLHRERPKHNWKKVQHCEKTNEIMACLERGERVCELSRRFGVSKQWVSQLKKKMESENE